MAVVAFLASASPPAAAQSVPVDDRARALKSLQQRRVLDHAQARLDRALGFSEPTGEADAAVQLAGADETAGTTSFSPNSIVNNRATDTATCGSPPCTGLPWSGQSSPTIGAIGNNLVAAWNDGEGFVTGFSTIGYGYSIDGGVTWVDGGVPPTTGGVGIWTSNPVIAVNENNGGFYLAATCEPTLSTNGVAVVKGTFIGGAIAWGTPRVVVQGSYNSVVFDAPWVAADPVSGNLYLTYTRYTAIGGSITSNRIDFTFTNLDNASPWAAPVTLSSAADAGLVQGPRVAVGPAGEVWTVWNAIGVDPPYADHMRVRRITGGGTVLGAQANAADEFTHFGSGAPGFNRGIGFAFPALAVDRTGGPYSGRVYLAWNESVNFYDDALGNMGATAESEPNNTPGTGTPFTMGRILTGAISSANDFDYWSFAGVQGQTVICHLDCTSAPALDATFRLFCSDGATRLAFSETGLAGSGLIVFTIPANGTYALRVASTSPDGVTPPGTGPYTISTGLNGAITERARDHRDVFVTSSDNGSSWSTPVRVNDDPARYDNWLPEIVVADIGRPYVIWYDWRDAPPSTCAGVSNVYLARSDDGGGSWTQLGPVTDAPTAWTTTYSNIAPNQGDHMALFGNTVMLHPAWTDGRHGDPDIFTVPIPLIVVPIAVSLAGTYAEPGLVRLTWYAPAPDERVATVYRRAGDQAWSDLGRVVPDGTGRIVFEDRAVAAGTRYLYRLGLRDGAGETLTDEVAVDVPLAVAPELAIQHVRPNPSAREMWVSFSLPAGEAARLELLDISGRRVRERTVAGAGQQMVDLAAAGSRLAPGIYIVRLTQGPRSVVTRASVVR
ncbi:MAG TPA: T9SS type A sorting domain-containing protein [Candidatus Eisenbacteria bacterium]|nr:T9SS type A sorting domain-containing protein [Candidatus Eisenbacteria bacterium]